MVSCYKSLTVEFELRQYHIAQSLGGVQHMSQCHTAGGATRPTPVSPAALTQCTNQETSRADPQAGAHPRYTNRAPQTPSEGKSSITS